VRYTTRIEIAQNVKYDVVQNTALYVGSSAIFAANEAT
jgi:hypothetical protein